MFMMIKCRSRLVRDSAMCRQSEVLSQISRPSEGRPSVRTSINVKHL